MTEDVPQTSTHDRAFAFAASVACLALTLIALYSSGVDLIDPKLHRAVGFALALLVAIAAAHHKRRSAGKNLGTLQ